MTSLQRIIATGVAAATFALTIETVSAQPAGERVIRVAVSTAADHPLTVGAQKFAELIEAKSGGKLKARVFPGAALGSDVQVIGSLQGGVIEATVITTGLLTSMAKEYSLLILPGLFRDVREADAVLDGPFGTKLRDKLQERQLVGLTYMEHGFKNVTNSKRPITKWEDIEGLKLRVTQTPTLVDTFSRLGANPVPMAFNELYSALEQRAVDGIETTLATFNSAKLEEVQKYILMTQHIYDPLMLIYSKPLWDKLSADERKLLSDAATEAAKFQRQQTRDQESKLLATLRQKGVVINDMTQQEKARMRERLQPVIDKHMQLVGEAASREFVAEIEKARSAIAGK